MTNQAEELAKATGGEVASNEEWESGEEIPSSWFKFENVGDMVKGTLVSKRFQKSQDPIYPDQWIYELKTEKGVITKVGISKSFVNDKMRYIVEGQIVAFKFTKEVPSQKYKGKFAKSIDVRVFGMDPDYSAEQQAVDEDEINVDDIPFDK